MQKNAYIAYILPLVLAVGLSACRNAAAQSGGENTYISYYIRYTEDDARLKADVTFKKGDSLAVATPITVAGGVALNGTPLPMVETDLGAYYTAQGARTKFDSTFTFSYNDPYMGKLNSLPLVLHTARQPTVDKLSVSEGGTLTWQGLPLAAGDVLLVQIEDKNGSVEETHIVGPTAAAQFKLRAGQIGKPAVGAATLQLMREHIAPIPASPHTTGSAHTEYYATPIKVVIVP